jgi:hypothetical protein
MAAVFVNDPIRAVAKAFPNLTMHRKSRRATCESIGLRTILVDVVVLVVISVFLQSAVAQADQPSRKYDRIIEWTINSHKVYADPFNDVDVDVIFSRAGQSWRIPTFWRGSQQWTVRFAPPEPGEYSYRLESTDPRNPDLNGHPGVITVAAYAGQNELLKHGMLRVSEDRRHFEFVDGTPFYWLADTWWTGLSDRLSWPGFQKLTADRKAKGFTLIQVVAGLVPPEEFAPADPGFHNEGGFVWDPQFKRINPQYFDYADRRIFYLLDNGIIPAIVGAWNPVLEQMGVSKMKKHWRYIIARYGAYPAFWIVGGEVFDPPVAAMPKFDVADRPTIPGGWTEVARYIRAIDPYHHPLTAHENPPPFDYPLQDESLIDFDMFQSGHYGWASIGVEVAQLDQHYSRTVVGKPIVEGEIGYEKLGETHFEDFQRAAFWLSMLNGAAGHTYGANGVWEAYTSDRPLHRKRWSFMNWEEGMNLPGSYQVGLGAKLLRQYPWWRMAPHPEWVTPRGTTLLEPHPQINGFQFGTFKSCDDCEPGDRVAELDANYVAAEWKAQNGTFRLPYAAGIPRELRFVYVPAVGLVPPVAPTVLALEPDVHYRAYWWEPSSGTRVDLGAVERPALGPTLVELPKIEARTSSWKEHGSADTAGFNGAPSESNATFAILERISERNAVATVGATSSAQVGLILRFQDLDNYVAAIYSPEAKRLFVIERRKGVSSHPLGRTPVSKTGEHFKLSFEVRENNAAASLADGEHTYATPIVDLGGVSAGGAGLFEPGPGELQSYDHFLLRRGAALPESQSLQRSLYDEAGGFRGCISGPGMIIGSLKAPSWDSLGHDNHRLLDAFRPDRLPTTGDWLLVLDTEPPK